MRKSIITLAAVLLSWGAVAESDPFQFPEADNLAKPWTRTWWLGNAVDRENLTRWLETLSAAGLGGVEIVPIYGVKGQTDRNLEHLSPEWLAMMAHTTNEAARLGMGVDMPTGTGWPFGGPSVRVEEADATVTVTPAERPSPGGGIGLPEDAMLHAFMAYGPDGVTRDLTPKVRDGVFTGDGAPEGSRYFLVYSRFSGRHVKRAAPGGAGLTANPYSGDAIEAYLAYFSRGWDQFDGTPLRAFSHDSFEYAGDWAPGVWDAITALHGYDLRDHLPELTGEGDRDRVARVKADYRATLAELLLNDFVGPWVAWAHRQGSGTRNQAHGSPGNLLDLYAVSDIPETEIFGPSGFPIPGLRTDPAFDNEPPDLLMLKFASSAAHTTGKPLVSAETCTWLGEHFQVSLAQCKPEIDQLLAAGINHIAYHGTPYSPAEAAWPGWLFYASVHFAPTNTWWDDFAYLNEYIARSQALLQASQPANDVLLYFPVHDIWHEAEGMRRQLSVHYIDDWLIGTPFYETATWLTGAGYTFDYVSDRILGDATVVEGQIVLGGNPYRALVVPETPRMPVATLERIAGLVEQGATVAFQGALPADVPGLGRLEERRAQLKSLHAPLRQAGAPDSDSARAERGRVYEGASLDTALADAGVRPEALATSGLAMNRRRHDEGWLYFVSNLSADAVDAFWPLATPSRSVVAMDALSGRAGLAETRVESGATAVRISLRPGESCFLRTFSERDVKGEPWPYWQVAGDAITVDAEWEISFLQGGPALPNGYRTRSLESWTNAPDDEAKRFGGTARYRIEFDAPGVTPEAWRLDLGRVCESARVTLNGTYLGCAWSLPYTLDFTETLRASGNVLEIDVTNLAANRIADMDRRGVEWKIFEEINFVDIRYRPFDASGWPLFDSGLLGPVRFFPLAR